MLNGCRLVGISRETVLSAERFSAELDRHGVTTLFVTTALFNELVHARADTVPSAGGFLVTYIDPTTRLQTTVSGQAVLYGLQERFFERREIPIAVSGNRSQFFQDGPLGAGDTLPGKDGLDAVFDPSK